MYDDWHSNNDVDVDEFYDDTVEYVQDNLRDAGAVILHRYAEYHRDHPYADAYDLREYLCELLQDPSNY